MLEIMIAVGIGVWFLFCGIVSFCAISKTFKGEEDKKE